MADYINVTSLNRLAKRVLEQCDPLNDLIVCGEISGFKRIECQMPIPLGEVQPRPRLPLPCVCTSAINTLPSGEVLLSFARLFVVSVSSYINNL